MAQRPIEEPQLTETTENHGERWEHPAFGQVTVSRHHGGDTYLYGSDFSHHSYICMTVHKSVLNRNLSDDWPFQREELISFFLSEAQWASMVSSIGVGRGTQCTLYHVAGELQPQLAPPISRTEQFKEELTGALAKDVEKLKGYRDEIAALGLPKGKTSALRAALDKAIQDLQLNVPFIVKQFDEHAEETVEKIKAEVHGYANSVLNHLGLQAIQERRNVPLPAGGITLLQNDPVLDGAGEAGKEFLLSIPHVHNLEVRDCDSKSLEWLVDNGYAKILPLEDKPSPYWRVTLTGLGEAYVAAVRP